MPEKAEGKTTWYAVARKLFDVLMLAVWEACLFNNMKSYRLFLPILNMCLSGNVSLKQNLVTKSFFPLFIKLKKNSLRYRRGVQEVQNENGSGKVLAEAAQVRGCCGQQPSRLWLFTQWPGRGARMKFTLFRYQCPSV